jgi:hypothetical protein
MLICMYFPWLKYWVDAPSAGLQYLIQISCRPNKRTEFYTRYRNRIKPLNIETGEKNSNNQVPGLQYFHNWRSQLEYHVNRSIALRSRLELCMFSHQFQLIPETGYLFFTDLAYKPTSSWFSGNIRYQVFESTSYDTWIYAYENDVLFASSTPAYYNNGVRYYINLAGKFKPKLLSSRLLTISLKIASTVYTKKPLADSLTSAVNGNRISNLKLQIFLRP